MRKVVLVLLLCVGWESPVLAESPDEEPKKTVAKTTKRPRPPRRRIPRHHYTFSYDRERKPVAKDECEWRNHEARTRTRDWGIEERHRASLALPKCPTPST